MLNARACGPRKIDIVIPINFSFNTIERVGIFATDIYIDLLTGFRYLENFQD